MKTKIKLITTLTASLLIINNSYAQNISLPQTAPKPPADLKIVSASNLPPMQMPVMPVMPMTQPTGQPAMGLQFNEITIANLLKVVFSEVIQTNYVLSTKIITDDRPISFRYNKAKDGNIENFLGTFLKSLGYEMKLKNGVYYVEEPPQKTAIDYDYYVYTPKYRTANYIADQIRPYFQESFTASNREVNTPTRTPSSQTENLPATNALAMGDKSYDILSFKYDNPKLKDKILKFIKQIDTEEQNVIIKAIAYEVSYTDQDGSALGLMANIAHSKLGVQLGAVNPLDNVLRFSSNALSIFVSNLAVDNRVKLVSNQVVTVKNGEEANFKAGQKIPTLGSVSYQGTSGTPVQNIEKVDTGSIITVTPKIKKNVIDINLYQEISEAVNTTTGVNNSPTIQQRSLKSNFGTHLNEVVMIAGLTQVKKTANANQPFFLPWFKSNTTQNSKTDIVIFLEILPSKATEIPEEIIDQLDTK